MNCLRLSILAKKTKSKTFIRHF